MNLINYLFDMIFKSKAFARNSLGFPLLEAPGGDPSQYGLIHVIYFIGNIINVLLTLVGAVAVIYIIIGGIKYMTATGQPEGIAQAKATIMWAVIGLIIAVAGLIIITFFYNQFISGGLPYPT